MVWFLLWSAEIRSLFVLLGSLPYVGGNCLGVRWDRSAQRSNGARDRWPHASHRSTSLARRSHESFACHHRRSSDEHCRSALSRMDAQPSDRMVVAGYRRGLSGSLYAVEESSSHLHIH